MQRVYSLYIHIYVYTHPIFKLLIYSCKQTDIGSLDMHEDTVNNDTRMTVFAYTEQNTLMFEEHCFMENLKLLSQVTTKYLKSQGFLPLQWPFTGLQLQVRNTQVHSVRYVFISQLKESYPYLRMKKLRIRQIIQTFQEFSFPCYTFW